VNFELGTSYKLAPAGVLLLSLNMLMEGHVQQK